MVPECPGPSGRASRRPHRAGRPGRTGPKALGRRGEDEEAVGRRRTRQSGGTAGVALGRRPMSVLVGIDVSAQGTAALRWAAKEAALRMTTLRVLHAFPWPLPGVVADPRHLEMWDAARRLVAEAEYWAKSITPAVVTELVTGAPSPALVQRS